MTGEGAPDPTPGLLAAALERTLTVAREGEEETPPRPVPAPLKRYLSFQHLPRRALQAVQRVIEDDDELRARAANTVSEDDVGAAGFLWLTRPEGWRARFDELVAEVASQTEEAHAERSDQRLERRLAAAEAKAERAEARAAEDGRLAEDARRDLGVERRRRRASEQQVEGLERRVTELRAELERQQRARTDAEGALAAREGEIVQAREQLRALDAELERRPRVAPRPGIDPDDLRGSLARAREAAESLSDALEDLVDTVEDHPLPPPSAEKPVEPEGRTPVPLPTGLRADTAQAADFLLRRPGAVLLVDGYNVSMAAWPDEPIAEQRRRLLDALAAVAASTGVEPDVVFDGTDTDTPLVRSPGSAVRVRFTSSATEADDLILELVDTYPARRPVLVASNDRRVRDGAAASGANTLRSEQLLDALRGARHAR